MGTERRVWSWARSTSDVEERQGHAQELVGLSLRSVRYLNIDFARDTVAPGASGARLISDPAEWQAPPWAYDDCDSIDFGIELETVCGRVFSMAWDPPGPREGLGLREGELIGPVLTPAAEIAIWDVSGTAQWIPLTGQIVTAVRLRYVPWGEGEAGFWCPRITVELTDRRVEFILGEGRRNQAVAPAATNVAVLFDPALLPEWVQRS